MKTCLVRHLWGVPLSDGMACHVNHWKSVGYQALEVSPRKVPDAGELFTVLTEHKLRWIPQIFSNEFDPTGGVQRHVDSLRMQIEECLDQSPWFFNSHSGSDIWSLREAVSFFEAVSAMESEYGIVIAHETHRLRVLGTPWRTMEVLSVLPDLKLTIDFSHWVCVCERLLPDLGGEIERAAQNAWHLHARVGHEQGPQVSDPFAPEWALHLEIHQRWWNMVWSAQHGTQREEMPVCPEFGPFPYQPCEPHSMRPLADLKGICDAMARRVASCFANLPQAPTST